MPSILILLIAVFGFAGDPGQVEQPDQMDKPEQGEYDNPEQDNEWDDKPEQDDSWDWDFPELDDPWDWGKPDQDEGDKPEQDDEWDDKPEQNDDWDDQPEQVEGDKPEQTDGGGCYVVFYEDEDFRGDSVRVYGPASVTSMNSNTFEEYAERSNANVRNWARRTDSIRVGQGAHLQLFERRHFRGDSYRIWGSVYDTDDMPIDDDFKSFKLTCK